MNKYILRLIFSVSILVYISSYSLNGQYRVTNYNYSHGLDIFSISDISEDSLGYIWLGSLNGFARFDGLEFRDVLSDSNFDINSIGAEVSDIKVDRKGRIWINFRDAGIAYYDPSSKTFIAKHYKPSDEDKFPKKGINEIHLDPYEERIWINSVLEGVFVMDMNSMESRKVINLSRHLAMSPDMINPDHIYFSERSGVWHLDINSMKKVKVFDKPLHKMIIKDQFLYGYSWTSYIHRINLKSLDVTTVEKTKKNVNRDALLIGKELWVSEIDGITIINFDNQTEYKPQFVDPQGNNLEIKKVIGLGKDRKDNIWIGTSAGVSVIYNDFQQLKCLDDYTDLKFYDIIKSPISDQYYALSFYGDKVFKADIFDNKIEVVSFEGNSDLEGPSKILERNNELWLAYKNGIAIINNNKIKQINHPILDKYLDKRGLSDMALGVDNCLYIIKAYHQQLFKYNPADKTCLQIPIEKITKSSKIKNINSDINGIWIGTDTGLYHYAYGSDSVSPAKILNDTSLIFTHAVENIRFDADGRLWMLSLKHGAWQCQIDSLTKELTIVNSYTKKDGLANNRPWDMAVFDDNYTVFGANGGMSVYDKSSNDFLSFRQEQGIPLDEIYVDAIDDKVFILSLGICYFEDLLPYQKSKALIVDIDPTILEHNTTFVNDQQLSATQNDVSIRYNTISMTYPRSVVYRYRLGEEIPWQESRFNNRIAVFNDLPPGDYNFKIQAKDRNTDWGPATSIQFSIAYPITQAWWFRALMILLFIGLVYLLYKYRINHLKKISSLKIKMNELENEALRSQMNPHFIFNSLNSIKSYIINNKKEEAADYLTTFSQLIRIVLENSKKKFVSLSDEISALELYIAIENIRLDDKFETTWTLDESLNLNQVYLPPLSLQPFIENAIWHGFMHKSEKGKLMIKINQQDDMLQITIEDNGVGRNKSAKIEKSFGRKRSFGIAITKERLAFKNKDSKISIEDLEDQDGNSAGTRVTILTPLNTTMPTK
jgi:ligand-binding sensor domain-containing protein